MSRNYHWDYHPGHKLSLSFCDEPLATYSFANVDGAKPFIHPLSTVDGVPLTVSQPSDHVWHRGVWFSWKYINGVNYWEEEPVRTEDEIRLLSEGRTRVARDEVARLSPDQAEVMTSIDYISPAGSSVIRERRLVRICVPKDNHYTIDWDLDFTVGTEAVILSATPITNETPWGGYSGLGWRAARSLRQFRTLNSEGATGETTSGAKARWIDLSGVADGDIDVVAGLAILDHPSNPRHPSPVYVFSDAEKFGYVNPSFVRDEKLELAPNARLNLKYRIVVHDGWPDPVSIEREFLAFAALR
ncbi:DUF6807 domain-containing protein [Mesorhizobium neociceri]|uniref:PmoA family protein n=1 Tax=Mesorhizobium neociceri TaxID=1307853 RepID=A0A838BFV5_9HYPH|nr:PmoA family protein [Mesorhizobium neociceri]MBA1145375.1 PmoA family protein [Mesorhizobium neociceri]